MPRGKRIQRTYTGKALKVYEKVQRLDAELKAAKAELKIAYKEQLKEEKAAAKERVKNDQAVILKALKDSDKSTEEILAFLEKQQHSGKEQ